MTARELAINLIKPYVLRGDDPEDLKKSYLGHGDSEAFIHIGGYAKGKLYSTDKIIVELRKDESLEIFSFWDIVKEIEDGKKQQALF